MLNLHYRFNTNSICYFFYYFLYNYNKNIIYYSKRLCACVLLKSIFVIFVLQNKILNKRHCFFFGDSTPHKCMYDVYINNVNYIFIFC